MTPLTDVKTPSPLFSLSPRENLRVSNFSLTRFLPSSILFDVSIFISYPTKKMGKKKKLVWGWVLMLTLKSNSYSPKQNHRKPILLPKPNNRFLAKLHVASPIWRLVSRFGFERKSKALRNLFLFLPVRHSPIDLQTHLPHLEKWN